jgi:hypothetical protein
MGKITWRNLWRQFMFAPGTAVIRLKLVMWQIFLMTASSTGALAGSLFGFIPALMGAIIGFVGAWLVHELGFKWYAESYVGIQEVDMFPNQLGEKPVYVATIERYWGPFASDKVTK